MIPDSSNVPLATAIADFRRARSQADLKALLARLTGSSNELLSYDEVRQALHLQGSADRGLKDIPLDAILGSVGRYTDFTRDFLPRQEVNAERWARIKIAASGMVGLPPIEVYQIGEVYFVKDGNHRVSVARQLGATYIQAYVTEVHTRVPLTPDITPDDLILKAEYGQFLEQTRLDILRPDSDLSVTIPGQYQILLEHIDVHRYYMGLNLRRDIPHEEAVTHWYDTVYLPVIEIIRNQGILHHFPQRTEIDLYLWISQHRAQLEELLGVKIGTGSAANDLVEQFSTLRQNWFGRLFDTLWPDNLEAGPPTGEWRIKAVAARPDDRLFIDILVPLNGREDGWCALEQAINLAQREGSRLHGLHVLSDPSQESTDHIQHIHDYFEKRCTETQVTGKLTTAPGQIVDQICMRAKFADLVVVNLTYPPAPQPLARLSSGFRDLIQRCPRPILATPQTVSSFKQALLAFDGSPKAQEALFVATYLSGRWNLPLFVVCVVDTDQPTSDSLEQARSYLEAHNIQANYVTENGPIGPAILKTSEQHGCDLIIMGGYGHSPVVEVVMGSSLDRVLREGHTPVLICR